MHRAYRPLVVFGTSVALSVSLLQFVNGAHGSSVSPSPAAISGLSIAAYDLTQLEILEPTLYHVEENYVEPDRIDYEQMFIGALEAIERRVPVCMFGRKKDGSRVTVQIGAFQTVLEVGPIQTRRGLQRELEQIAVLIREHLAESDIPNVPEEYSPYAEVEYALVNGVLDTLDPHSLLLPPEASREMDVDNQGEFGGLGITIVLREGRLTIEYPLKDTPAERAGLLPDDHISRIDGQSTINMSLSEAVALLRGLVGEPVDIEVKREGEPKPLAIRIVREAIRINPVESDVLEGGVGYVSIKNFHQKVESDLHTELTRMNRETGGLRGLVLDLRSNPGGFLSQAVAAADTFLWDGTIVSTVDGNGRKGEERTARAGGAESDYPIVVLVNANSASASEIVAGALRNNERAVIVGERTFGKGSVQNLHQFFDESKLKITISEYLTPGDKSIQSVGIPADIQLNPSIIEPADGEAEPVVRLYWRERTRREADLDHHLAQKSLHVEEPVYELRYVLDADRETRRTAELNLSEDYEVQFARDLILSSPSYHRSEILAAAAKVVSEHERRGQETLQKAFKEIGIDWSSGAGVTDPQLDVRVGVEGDDLLKVGIEQQVYLEVTNRGKEPIFRLAAVAEENEVLDGREFFFGRLNPGETRRFDQKVRLVPGYPSEEAPILFKFRDGKNDELLSVERPLVVEGRARPELSWQWKLEKMGEEAPGVISAGAKYRLNLTVNNRAGGPSEELFARIKNQSGRALDILRGTLEPGPMLDAKGAPCEVLQPGIEGGNVIGDLDANPERKEAGDRPEYALDCERQLSVGKSWSGSFEFEIKEPLDKDYTISLSIGDAQAYDHASVVRAGFYGYFSQEQEITFALGDALAGSDVNIPPRIQVTRQPGAASETGSVSISGVVTDDVGLVHVMVYASENKVFYQGGPKDSGLKSLPFTADVNLEPGINTVTVLATDSDGFTHTQSVVTEYKPPGTTD
jgi:carboxyl-terminal processing protease